MKSFVSYDLWGQCRAMVMYLYHVTGSLGKTLNANGMANGVCMCCMNVSLVEQMPSPV